MTCLESMQSPTQKLRNSFLSILVPIILRSDKNCGCASIFRDAGVRILRFTRHWAWNYGFCINSINNKDILVLFVVIPMYFRSGKWNMTKNMVATPSRAANQAKSKMAAILSENCNNSHEICTNWHRMVVLVSKCRFINSRNNINTTKNLYVKYLMAKSKMAAILSEKSKYSHEIWINWPRMVV